MASRSSFSCAAKAGASRARRSRSTDRPSSPPRRRCRAVHEGELAAHLMEFPANRPSHQGRGVVFLVGRMTRRSPPAPIRCADLRRCRSRRRRAADTYGIDVDRRPGHDHREASRGPLPASWISARRREHPAAGPVGARASGEQSLLLRRQRRLDEGRKRQAVEGTADADALRPAAATSATVIPGLSQPVTTLAAGRSPRPQADLRAVRRPGAYSTSAPATE